MGFPRVRPMEKLPERVDVVIVGGGAAGVSTAYAFARLGYAEQLSILLLEKGYLGRGSATRNAGRFRVHFFSRENTRFAIESRKRILELPKLTGVNPVIVLGGYLWLFESEEAYRAFSRFNEQLWKPMGVPVEVMAVDEARERFPHINVEGFVGAVFGPQDGSVHHDYMVMGMASYASKRGVGIALYRRVEEIVVEGGRVRGVRVEGYGTIEARNVVIAAGVWSGKLLSKLGISLPLKPVRKSLLVTEPYRYILREFVVLFERGSYVAQTPKGEIMATERYPAGEPETTSYEGVSLRWLIATAKLIDRLLGGVGVNVMRVWSGHYNMTPDHSHILGRDPEWPEGLYVITGFSGHGLMMSPYAGELLAVNIAEDRIPGDMKPYLPTRFKEGKLIHEELVIG